MRQQDHICLLNFKSSLLRKLLHLLDSYANRVLIVFFIIIYVGFNFLC